MKSPKKRGRKPGFKMSEETKRKLSIARTDPKVTARKERIFDYIMNNGHDLNRSLRPGLADDIAEALGMKKSNVIRDVGTIRRECGITDTNRKSDIPGKRVLTDVHRYLIRFKMFRASLLETPICDKIVDVLNKETLFPSGGAALLFGTATPECVLEKNPTRIITDNLDVGKAMYRTTYEISRIPMLIVVGNAEDEDKAEQKVYLWRSHMWSNVVVKPDIVDKNSFEYTIKRMVKRHKHTLVKVVLLTSGVWKHRHQSQKKHGKLDLRFEMAAIKLTRKYSNLHILAMCKNNSYGFDLRHLHNNRNEVIYKNGMKEVNSYEYCNS